jgi:hypothetical protein
MPQRKGSRTTHLGERQVLRTRPLLARFRPTPGRCPPAWSASGRPPLAGNLVPLGVGRTRLAGTVARGLPDCQDRRSRTGTCDPVEPGDQGSAERSCTDAPVLAAPDPTSTGGIGFHPGSTSHRRPPRGAEHRPGRRFRALRSATGLPNQARNVWAVSTLPSTTLKVERLRSDAARHSCGGWPGGAAYLAREEARHGVSPTPVDARSHTREVRVGTCD